MKSLFLDLLERGNVYKDALSSTEENSISITGLTDTAKPHFLLGLLNKTGKNLIVTVKNESYGRKLGEMLSFFGIEYNFFREREFDFYNIDAKSNEIFLSRISALEKAKDGKASVYITTLDALNQPVIPKEILVQTELSIKVGESIEPTLLSRKLFEMGYQRASMVEGAGQFSLRGDVFDVFTPLREFPLRIEFFGDEIDSIRVFNEKTQLSVETLSEAQITVAREVVFNDDKKKELIGELKKRLKKIKNEKLITELSSDIEKLENQQYFHSIDKYINLVYEGMPTFLDYFDKENTIVVIDEPQRMAEKKEALKVEREEQIKALVENGYILPEFSIYEDVEETVLKILGFKVVGMMNILTSHTLYKPCKIINVTTADTPTYYGKLNLLCEDIINYKNKGYRVVLPVPEKKVSNFKNYLLNSSIIATETDENASIEKPGVYLLKKSGVMGFNYPEDKFVLLYDASVFGEQKEKKKKPTKKNDILSFSDLQPGDYVVHTIHGIGKYIGTEKMTVENVTRDFLKIQYRGTDCLYVPINQLENLNKYIGAAEKEVRLNKLGGQEFTKMKQRVKAACADLADKLIALYAERSRVKGHKYMEDTDLQAMFEQTFPYEETDDQLRSIEEVKKDMESDKPMDRLLCGDVGYGKTEVAMRAAFKCAAEGKQTAYLASTTVLAQQHYNSFKSRMEDFPVKVEMLSRFRSKKEQENIIKRLKAGEIDIVIGTHRLLSKDVEFKDLGLLIVDEEQRFGVEHKERLKEIKNNIEVLTLTATPIPRTLHMSMLGIRDMSVLKEPPQDRYPVQTYVLEYNEQIVANAITKEISRGGQIFYLYNNVQNINSVALRIKELCPDAEVAVAHGKMSETAIEKTFIRMLNGEIDVLVCTTIIETGIDIANANTIIVENSDQLGLSQLYQLRGRVGRSNRLAYCYLTYKKNKALTELSEKRLKTIKEFTEFGSGFKVALRDLEIRGAGNVLGAQQHGQMDAVGYDMYIKLLEEAIKEKKGEETKAVINCKVDIKMNAYIPETYIENHDMRMDMYKKIAGIKTKEDASDITDELIDRFSEPPESVLNLIDISYIKAMAESVGIFELTDFNLKVTFNFFDVSYLDFEKISLISEKFKDRIMINSGSVPGFTYRLYKEDMKNKAENIKNILQMLK